MPRQGKSPKVLIAQSHITDDDLVVSRALMVAATFAGLVVPRYGSLPAHVLQPAELVLLEGLARRDGVTITELCAAAADRTGWQPSQFEPVLDALRRRGLLVPAGRTSTGSDPAARPAPAEREVHQVTDRLVLTPSIVFRVASEGFEHLDEGRAIDARLTALELHAVSQFTLPATRDDAFASHVELASEGGLSIPRSDFDRVVAGLVAEGLLQRFDPDNPLHSGHTQNVDQLRDAIRRRHGVVQALDRATEQHDEAAAREPTATRTAVVPVVDSTNYWALPPVALGFLVAYAKAYDGGRLESRYDFHPRWVTDTERLGVVSAEPGIFLFSNYIWCHDVNRGLSAFVKQQNPASITIHGGPDTPKYEGDCEHYFRDNPHVDVTVRGEGEATFAEILDALGPLGANPPDLSTLQDVPGLSYRDGDRVVRTADRDRITDLDTIPSPYLTGLFDAFGDGLAEAMILETNRGCPYGCTFCDWGSATASRIRKFDLDRVMAELEWCARNRIHTVSVADANFGIFERDVEIAKRVAELKAEHGYPQLFATNYAKNTVKHLRPIIEVLAESDIIIEGKVSLQSMDADTLLTINRSNIKVEKYDELAVEFRKAKLPLSVDLMMGLPGATATSFRSDLQECIDREMPAIIHTTTLLANSPMNDPAYRTEHGIEARPGEIVDHARTFSRGEFDKMALLRGVYLLCDKYGVLRQVAAYVRQETGIPEVEFYERLLDDAIAAPDDWPTLAYTLLAGPEIMAPPCSWRMLVDDVHRYVTDVLGVADDAALATVLAVQHAVLPAVGRRFPEVVELDHDYAAWHQAMLMAKENGARGTWPGRIPHLREYPPATFVVTDPADVCRSKIGGSVESLSMMLVGWELGSPVTRSLMSSAPGG
jgi:hypothetical protein